MGDRRPSGASHRSLHWWHLAAVLVLIAAVESGEALIAGVAPWSVLLALPHSIYMWCPILAGVAISIRRADRRTARAAVEIGVTVAVLMLVLDMAGSLSHLPTGQSSAFTTRGFTSMGTDESGTGWVRVAAEWLQGELSGLGERVPPGQAYPDAHPRLRAAEALVDGSLTLLVFAVLGLVLAGGRWIRTHVTFSRPEDERAAHLVVAWLLAPMALGIALRQSENLFYSALFQGGPLWAILLPPLAMLGVGIAAWIWSAKDPPPHDSSSPNEHEQAERTAGE